MISQVCGTTRVFNHCATNCPIHLLQGAPRKLRLNRRHRREFQPKWSTAKRHESCRKLGYWLCRRKRASHLVTNPKLHNFCLEISSKKLEKEIQKQVPERVATENHNNRAVISLLKSDGVKPSNASYIRSNNDVSLMKTMLYYIDVDWFGLHDMLIGATNFSCERHSSDAIRQQTVAHLQSVGWTFDDIHTKISDKESNIQKAWRGLPSRCCTTHTHWNWL